MNKSELVIEIINICDENTRLKNEIEILKNSSDKKVTANNLVIEDKRILELTKEYLFEKCFSTYAGVYKTTNDDGEEGYTSFNNWHSSAFKKEKIPCNLTSNEIKELTMELAKKEYEKKLAEAKEED